MTPEQARAYHRDWRHRHADSLRARRKAAQARLRAIVDEAKARPCMDCDSTFPGVAMDFDHRDPETKKYNISAVLVGQGSYAEATLRAEMAKCDIVCANCHRVRTHRADSERSHRADAFTVASHAVTVAG